MRRCRGAVERTLSGCWVVGLDVLQSRRRYGGSLEAPTEDFVTRRAANARIALSSFLAWEAAELRAIRGRVRGPMDSADEGL